jgi:O-glycosyl hydrolase
MLLAASSAPAVTSVGPVNGATGVAISSNVIADFSQVMNSTTITTSTFTLKTSTGAAVAGTVLVPQIGTSASFTPTANLAYSTKYTATLTTGIKNQSGTPLAANYTWSFTTVAAPPAPAVTSTSPAKGATGVSITQVVSATFNVPMNAATINSGSFTLTAAGGATITGGVGYTATGSVATFLPSSSLKYSTTYTAKILAGVQSVAGTSMASAYSWTFTTAAPPPAPTVTSTSPAKSATGVPTSQVVTATFSTAMNPATISASTFTLTAPGGAAVAGAVSCNSTCSVASFTPSANLLNGTMYTATVTSGAQNAAGTAMASNYTWTFTTVPPPAPTVVSTSPLKGAGTASISQGITATFSQPMNASTFTSSTFYMVISTGAAVKGTLSLSSDGFTETFSPSANLSYNSSYTVTITTGVKSAAGVAMAAKYTWSFNTGPAPLNPAVIDFGSSLQTIRGFGGSSAWISNFTSSKADTLFGNANNQQMGLSLLRVRIDPGGSSNWGQELNNAQLAIARGASVFATPWSPPASMKTGSAGAPYNGNGSNPLNGGSLETQHYADYANYLESFVTYMAKGGVNLYGISMQNEPEENVDYESCIWTPSQMDTWVAQDSSVLTTKLIMPESATFNPAFADVALNDANAVGKIAIIGGHQYGGPPAAFPLAQNLGKDLWMTEHYIQTSGIQGALALAQEIHESLTVGNYNAYVYWWIEDTAAEGYPWGLMDANANITQFGYAMAQFSKFVRPGYMRSTATNNPNPLVFVSAYKGNGHFVIVALNMGTTAVNQPFTVENQSLTTLMPFQTSASENLKQLSPISVSSGTFTYLLPAQSITTLVQ